MYLQQWIHGLIDLEIDYGDEQGTQYIKLTFGWNGFCYNSQKSSFIVRY